MASYVALQPHYNLMERSEYERELAPICERAGLACLPYFSLARGFLTGKYRRERPPVNSARADSVAGYLNEWGFAVLDVLDEVAAAQRTTVAAVALAWLLAQPTVAAPVASATSPQQLAELLPAAALNLTDAQLERLDAASAQPAVGRG